MLLASIIAFVVIRKLTIVASNNDAEEAEVRPVIEDADDSDEGGFSTQNYLLLKRTGKFRFIAKFCKIVTFFFFFF